MSKPRDTLTSAFKSGNMKQLGQFVRPQKGLLMEDLVRVMATYQHFVRQFGDAFTPLHVAVNIGKAELCRKLIQEGADVNIDIPIANRPLHIALETGHLNVIKMLINHGADVSGINSEGNTPMFDALTVKTRICSIEALLAAGVSVNASIEARCETTALHKAVHIGQTYVASFLLKKGADVNVQDKNGLTPLHFAVLKRDLDLAKLLILHGADLYLENKEGANPLIHAIKLNITTPAIDIIRLLLDKGCDVNRLSKNNSTRPLHLAALISNLQVTELLLKYGADVNKSIEPENEIPLHIITGRKRTLDMNPERVKEAKLITQLLIDKGSNVNAVCVSIFGGQTGTPLQLAVCNGYLGIAKILVRNGADLNVMYTEGSFLTPFHLVSKLNKDIVMLFLEYGGDYNISSRYIPLSPYQMAITHNPNVKYIKAFLKHGSPFDQNNFIISTQPTINRFLEVQGQFFKAITQNDVKSVCDAINEGAVAKAYSVQMKFPLHFVSANGYIDLARILLENNSSVNDINEKGETALYLAAKFGHLDVCYVLLEYGAFYNCISLKCHKTPVAVAQENNNVMIVDVFCALNQCFKDVRIGKYRVVHFLENKLKKHKRDFHVFANALNNKGNTLMQTALLSNRRDIAQGIMNLRLKCV